MSGKGSWRSRFVRGTKTLFGKAKNIYHDTTKTRFQKAKYIGTKITDTTITKPFQYVSNPNGPRSKKIAAGAAGTLGAITASSVIIPGAALGATTAGIGGITRIAAPVVGAVAGTAVGAAKGAIEAPFRTTYGLLKAPIINAPTAAVRGIKYSLAKQRFQKRTGVSNRTLSNIEHLETKHNKAQTELAELIKRQEAKLEKKALTLSPDALDTKLQHYENQRKKLEEKIADRAQAIENAADKKLTKKRFSKAKRGDKTEFILEIKRDIDESNEDFGKRVGVKKQNKEKNTAYTNRLRAFVQGNGDTKAAYLKRRIQQQYEVQKLAYNEAITKDIKAKQSELRNKLSSIQDIKDAKQAEIKTQQEILNKYKNDTKKKDYDYFKAIAAKAQAQRDLKEQEHIISNVQKKLSSAEAKEGRILMTKGLNAKRQRMEKRRVRLEESKQNLTASGKDIISPLTSIYYGAKTGAQIGNTIGRQALKYGTFGMVKSGSSNSSQKISKSFNKLRNFGTSSTQKQNYNPKNKIHRDYETEIQKYATLLQEYKQKNIKPKLTDKSNTQTQLTDIKREITDLAKYYQTNKDKLSISQKIKINNFIDLLRENYMKYSKA